MISITKGSSNDGGGVVKARPQRNKNFLKLEKKVTTKLKGKPLVVGPLKKNTFFAASLSTLSIVC